MDGASRLRQHDNFHKQLSAFHKLTEAAERKFSKDTLYQMLRVLVKGIQQPKGSTRAHTEKDATYEHIDSIRKLQDTVSTFQGKKRRGIQKEEATHVVKYFHNFIREVSHLSDYKEYFDDRIYKCLYEYFYDPTKDTISGSYDTLDAGARVSNSVRFRDIGVSDDADSGNYSDDLSSRPRRQTLPKCHEQKPRNKSSDCSTLKPFNEPDCREKWSWAVKELHATNKRWENLLSKEQLDPNDFEVDSEHDVLHYPCHEQFVFIFRLLPDVFMKSYKSLELAKIWWTQANKCLNHFPVRNRDSVDFEYKSHSIRHKIRQLEACIHKGQKNFEEFQVVLATTTSREKRAEELAQDCEHLEELKIEAERKYNQALNERRALIQKFEYAIKGTSKYFELKSQLTAHDRRVSETYNALRVLRYQFEIIHDDFLVEVEVRPNFIRFTDHVKEMVSSLKETLNSMRAEKRQCEKELALIKTNCETMRTVMRKQVGSDKMKAPPGERSKRVTSRAAFKERDNTYDVIATASKKRPVKMGTVREKKQEVASPLWSESERSDGLAEADGHDADTEWAGGEKYTFAKYTRLLHLERKGRRVHLPKQPKTKSKPSRSVSKLPRPVQP
ncbi:uncharacterized protein LOC135477956 isoform X2 [Liolophura sinensis]